MVQAEDVLVDIAAEEAQGGGLKKLRDVTADLESIIPRGEGQMAMLSTADRIPVWNIHSGRQSSVLTDQLKFQLRKKFPANHPLAGQRVYSLKPIDAPELPQMKCWLHPEGELRDWLDSIGLRGKTCMKSNIPTEYAVRVHMQRKHSVAYELIQDERNREQTEKSDELQKAQLAAMERLAGGRSEGPTIYPCRIEGCQRFFDTERGRDFHERKEHKEA